MEQHLTFRQALVGLNLSLLDLRLQFSLESKQIGNQFKNVFTFFKLGLTDD